MASEENEAIAKFKASLRKDGVYGRELAILVDGFVEGWRAHQASGSIAAQLAVERSRAADAGDPDPNAGAVPTGGAE